MSSANWYPSDVVRELIPDKGERDELRADMPQLPRAFFDDAISVPPGWTNWPCAYLKLSDAYDDEYSDAADAGWARSAIAGTHLSIFTEPATVLDAIESLAARVDDDKPVGRTEEARGRRTT